MKNYKKVAFSLCAIASLSIGNEIVLPMNAFKVVKSCQDQPSAINLKLIKGDPQYTLNWEQEASQALYTKNRDKLTFLISDKNVYSNKSNILDLMNAFDSDKCTNAVKSIDKSFKSFVVKIQETLTGSIKKAEVHKETIVKDKFIILEEQYTKNKIELETLLKNKSNQIVDLENKNRAYLYNKKELESKLQAKDSKIKILENKILALSTKVAQNMTIESHPIVKQEHFSTPITHIVQHNTDNTTYMIKSEKGVNVRSDILKGFYATIIDELPKNTVLRLTDKVNFNNRWWGEFVYTKNSSKHLGWIPMSSTKMIVKGY